MNFEIKIDKKYNIGKIFVTILLIFTAHLAAFAEDTSENYKYYHGTKTEVVKDVYATTWQEVTKGEYDNYGESELKKKSTYYTTESDQNDYNYSDYTYTYYKDGEIITKDSYLKGLAQYQTASKVRMLVTNGTPIYYEFDDTQWNPIDETKYLSILTEEAKNCPFSQKANVDEGLKYYKINIIPTKADGKMYYLTTGAISDSDTSLGTVSIKLPNQSNATLYNIATNGEQTLIQEKKKELFFSDTIFYNISSSPAMYKSGNGSFINVDFINNNSIALYQWDYGNSILDNMIGDFVGNFITTVDRDDSSVAYGINGIAIKNCARIKNIIGNFIANYGISNVKEDRVYHLGIAINNSGIIGNIIGDFIGNYSTKTQESKSIISSGGAIYNSGTIGNISGDFIGNFAEGYIASSNVFQGVATAYGGAISNGGVIENISGNFIGNKLESSSTLNIKIEAYGGAIYNSGTIGNISGDFISNSVTATGTDSKAYGSAIYNSGTIGNISGDFISNSKGNVIYNAGTIGNITGNFVNNQDSAIYIKENSKVDSIIGNFIKNVNAISSERGNSSWKVGIISGNFIENNKRALSFSYSNGIVNSITGNFINNEANVYAHTGGAILIECKINSINANFTNNHISGTLPLGGALGMFNNRAHILSVIGDFTGNYSIHAGGAIATAGEGIDSLTGNFIDNYVLSTNAEAKGGAIYHYAEKLTLNADTQDMMFKGNYVKSTDPTKQLGGAIYSKGTMNMNAKEGHTISFIAPTENLVEGATYDTIYNDAGIININENETDKGTIIIGTELGGENGTVNLKHGTLAITSTGSVKNNTLNLNNNSIMELAGGIDTSTVNIKDNSTLNLYSTSTFLNTSNINVDGETATLNINNDTVNDLLINNLIVDNKNGTINVNKNSTDIGTIVLETELGSTTTGVVNVEHGKLSISSTGSIKNNTLNLNNNSIMDLAGEINNSTVNINESSILNLVTTGSFKNSSNLALNGGTLNLQNDSINALNLNTLNMSSNSNIKVDVDAITKTMDTVTATTISPSSSLNVSDIIILNIEEGNKEFTADFVSGTIGNQDLLTHITTDVKEVVTPIYKYNVIYQEDLANNIGQFKFSVPNENKFSPTAVASPVSAQIGGFTTQLNTYHEGFRYVDNIMNHTLLQRIAMRDRNKYAVADTTKGSPIYTASAEKSGWFNPYASFEKVGLNNGPTVDAITYGSYFGGDSEIYSLKNGWDAMHSVYGGYNGAYQTYDGINMNQNGATLGLTGMLMKGNFFTGLTANVGGSAGQAYTMYGTDNFAMLMAGVASKTGYNFEMRQGKYILQPSFMMSYSFVNTFDYTNAAGVDITSDPLHAIQIQPGIKFIANLKNGWQPYIAVSMVWNMIDKTKFFANDVALPQMSIKPYVQYGLGVQRKWGDRFTGYAQAMVRNGGRNGIALSFGFKWALGKNPSKL